MAFERPRLPWRIRDGEIPLGAHTSVVGVLDLSADAWPSKPDVEICLSQALAIADHGAEFLDVTAMPLQPEGRRTDSPSELQRIVPVLRKIRSRIEIPIAVTTYNGGTAERAIELGASIINDPSGLSIDPMLAKIINNSDVGLVLGHAPGGPESWTKSRPVARLMEAVLHDLDSSVGRARHAGIDRRRIVLDPGLGFGKRGPQNYEILDRLRDLTRLGQPVLVSPSRKPFLLETIRASDRDWTISAAAATALAVRGGAHLVRALEVESLRIAAQTGDRLLEAIEGAR